MTKKVTCTLPNASEEINGVQFVAGDDHVFAEGVDDDVAAQFEGIPGYVVEDEAGSAKATDAAAKASAKAAAKAAKLEADAKAAAEAEAAAKASAEGEQSKPNEGGE